jgi:hypothetical protein
MSGRLDTLVNHFFSSVSIPAPSIQRFTMEQYREGWQWPEWSVRPGIYFFEQRETLQYVGRALRTSLRQRLSNQCGAFGDPKWNAVIEDQTVVIGVVPLHADLWYLAAALEAYLIKECRPPFSRRIS